MSIKILWLLLLKSPSTDIDTLETISEIKQIWSFSKNVAILQRLTMLLITLYSFPRASEESIMKISVIWINIQEQLNQTSFIRRQTGIPFKLHFLEQLICRLRLESKVSAWLYGGFCEPIRTHLFSKFNVKQ